MRAMLMLGLALALVTTAPPAPEDVRRIPWVSPGQLRSGGGRTFVTRNVKAGHGYVLLVRARCALPRVSKRSFRPGRGPHRGRRGRKSRQPPVQAFGLDFKAYVGSFPRMSLDVGLDRSETTRLPFWASEENPLIRVQDETLARVNVRCTVGDLEVTDP